ncbi:acyl-CoA desaturase [Planosporangium flavigriseum]|uniref:Fatty acid desaturase n=1 Tax=Planosporangium flavigriseum TaxID=373681 RepID=A0A8J3LT79_9ACTN|nr:acyl-CoA desaturase [Planosporangium flavigriseum]NJC66621.1 acyl-CoA desaturase [Planosporangium flavigriseum]GIG73494.1 fatty acid desaturase [Planosporangium flavigriseum]
MAVHTSEPVSATAHLSDVDIKEIGRELDQLRDEITASLGESDARYIRRVIAVQRRLEVSGRTLLMVSILPPAWLAGTACLAVAKILENMEIGHNVLHGQWDWMRDPEIHSTTWEWDSATPADMWKHSHNFVHHTYTNVLGKDRDIGYAVLRVSPEQPWHPVYLAQPVYNAVLAAFFEWGIAIYDIELERAWRGEKSWAATLNQLRGVARKAGRQVVKDYLAFPLLAGPSALPALLGNITANMARNVWSHTVIFCGHFPDGAEVFPEDQLDGESRGEWYLRQLLGSANITGGPLLHLMTGNLSHQIEHHLFPDLPSNRYAEIAPKVRDLCERYGLRYNAGSLLRQTATVWKNVLRLALPSPSRRAAGDAVPDYFAATTR